MAGTCVRGDEHTASLKCWKFLDHLKSYQLFKKDFVSWCLFIHGRFTFSGEVVG